MGSVRVFRIGLAGFAGASLLCAAATSMPALIAARVLQGGAAALIQATARALIAGLPPARQSAGYGWLSVAAGLGIVLGPPVAGLLLSIEGWRLLFLVNLPVSAAAYVWVSRVEMGSHGATAWLRRSNPVVAAMIASSALGAGAAVILIMPPAILNAAGLPVWCVGVVGLLAPLGQVVVARGTGAIIARRGPLLPFFSGLAVMLTAVLGLTALGVKASADTFGLLLLFGSGSGLFQPAGFASALAAAEVSERARIGALVRLATNLGIAAGDWASAGMGPRPWLAAAALILGALAVTFHLHGIGSWRLAPRQ